MATLPDVIVTPSSPLTITDNNRNFGTVTIKPGGQIFIKTSADITVKQLTKESGTLKSVAPSAGNATNPRGLAASLEQSTPDISIMGTPGKSGNNGANGAAGNPGVPGTNASCNWASGCTDGSAGTNGAPGGNAGDASNGGKAGDVLPVRMSVGTLTGTLFLVSAGGEGGSGGIGGAGGNGGNGGKGGDGDSDGAYSHNGYAGGNGANGGNGGNGGDGGDGGNGALIMIRYATLSPNSQFVPNAYSSSPGAGGSGGVGGNGGAGGVGGSKGGTNGTPGAVGSAGKSGLPGSGHGQPSVFDIQQGTL
jgi:hypothetical protein